MTFIALRGPRKFKDGGVSFCWHCNKQLMLMKGGVFSYGRVVDKAGVEHRVHKQCLPRIVAEGDVKEVK